MPKGTGRFPGTADTAMFFPKPAPSAMTPYLMYPFHECHLEVGLAPNAFGAGSSSRPKHEEIDRFMFTEQFKKKQVAFHEPRPKFKAPDRSALRRTPEPEITADYGVR